MLKHTVIIRDLSGDPAGHANAIAAALDEASAEGNTVHSWQIIPAQFTTYEMHDKMHVDVVVPERLFMILVRAKTEGVKPAERSPIGMGMKS